MTSSTPGQGQQAGKGVLQQQRLVAERRWRLGLPSRCNRVSTLNPQP